MICFVSRGAKNTERRGGFTLIELLIVVAVIALLLAILLPALRKARTISQRITCGSNLRQIALAWHAYLDDNDERFYQVVNINHDFGGWKGTGGYAPHRPLNEYLSLPPEIKTNSITTVFRCPADRGGIFLRPPRELAYQHFGNSYQTNLMLIGPDQISLSSGPDKVLREEINKLLKDLKSTAVSNHSRVLLVGDNNWVAQWYSPIPGKDWHNKVEHYNLAFLDGHVEFLNIQKDFYITEEYTVLPFKVLYGLAYEVQGPEEP